MGREALWLRLLARGGPDAARGGSAKAGGAARGPLLALALLAAGVGLAACRPGGLGAAGEARLRIHRAPQPEAAERHCAWYGDARDGVLYFGISAFWPAYRKSGGDPAADLREPGPQLVGRFDLERRAFREPLAVGPADARAGVWDVLAHPNGRVYFTTFFGSAGWVDPRTGEARRLEAAGRGLAELAPGPEGGLLASRYASEGGGSGSVVWLGPEGAVRAEHRLEAPQGRLAAAKSVAWDPVRREAWVTTDLLPEEAEDAEAGETRHDTRVLAEDGALRRRFARPEVQFVAFAADGTGYFAERHGELLTLRVRPPERAERALLTGRYLPLDDAFPAEHDFVQEIRPEAGGHVVVTRWSGRVHRVDREGRVRSLALPRPDPQGLYYTGVLADGALCATFCGGVTVVCRGIAP